MIWRSVFDGHASGCGAAHRGLVQCLIFSTSVSCNGELKQCARNRYLLLPLILRLHFLAVLVLGSTYHIVTHQPLFQIHLYTIKIIITQQIFRSEISMPPCLKKNPGNTPESQRLLSTCWRQCFYKSQGFFLFF